MPAEGGKANINLMRHVSFFLSIVLSLIGPSTFLLIVLPLKRYQVSVHIPLADPGILPLRCENAITV